MKKRFCEYVFTMGLFLLACQDKIEAQDKIHLKDGTIVSCHITEIQDFILYAEVHNDPFLATFFADDVSHLDIDPKNTLVIRQLKQGIKEAMVYSNPLEDNHLHGFYFGMPYDSVYKKSRSLYKSDSLGNPILVPYDPMKTDLSDRLKSLTKSLTGNSLIWLIGGL